MPGQPAQKPSVPRSPNTRVLPASNEPGLWAADGARASVSSSYLFNIPIPYPPGATSAEDREATDVCVSLMNGFANDVKALDTILSYSREVRECMAARAFQHCAEKFYDGWEANKKAGIEFDAETMRRHLSMLNHANDLVSRLCNGVDTTDEQDRLGARVDVRLDKFLRTGK